MDEQQVFDCVLAISLAGDEAAIKARRDSLWVLGTTLLCAVLGRSDELTRERLLRGLERELRTDLAGIERLMRPSPYEFH
jgi:hypothetical protein